MLKRLIAGFCAFAALAGPGLAQQACEPSKLAATVDAYALEPFSARTWRVLQGKGDPMIDRSYQGQDIWDQQERWKKLTAAILPDAASLQNPDWNCRIGYPLEVLEKRAGSLGRDNPYVKQWLLAQEKVMQACSTQGADDIILPPPLDIEPAFANLQKEDRAYQEASVAFYRNKERALTLFRAIGASASPHRAAARYNVANLLANGRKLDEARAEATAILADPALASVHAITRQLVGYVANLQDTAQSWTGLIESNVAILETPAGKILASEDLKSEYARALHDIDYAGVRAKDGDWWIDGTLPENPTVSKALVDMSRKHAMVLWMMAGQSANEPYQQANWGLIGAKWNARMAGYFGKALALQPAASGISGPALTMLNAERALSDEASRKALWDAATTAMSAAAASCGTDPQTAAAGYLLGQAVRLSAMSGNFPEAYAGLEAAPFKTSRAFREQTILKLAQYLAGQGNVTELRKLRDRFITPDLLKSIPEADTIVDSFAEVAAFAAEDEAQFKNALRQHSDPASNIVLNLLPVKTLWAYAEDASFATPERALFARAAWTRDYALGHTPAKSQTEMLATLNPALGDAAAKAATDYAKAGPERLRLLTILRSPRFNILVAGPGDWKPESLKPDDFAGLDSSDHNDRNWWCPLEPDRQLGALRQQADQATGVSSTGEYWQKDHGDVFDLTQLESLNRNRDAMLRQHPMVKNVNWKEIEALAAMPSAPKKLTEAAIRWGKASTGGDGAPEALALAVKSTRYGCNWHGGHGRYSKPAQELLRKKFKDTVWAKATPYWFDCQRTELDKDYNKVTVCEPKTWAKQAPLK